MFTLEELLALLATLAAMSDEDRTAHLAGMSAEDRQQLADAMATHSADLAAAEPTDETLEALGAIATGLRQLGEFTAAEAADLADRQSRQQALADEIASVLAPVEGDGETGEGEGEGEGDGSNAEGATGEAPVPIAAGAGAPARVPVATRVAARRPNNALVPNTREPNPAHVGVGAGNAVVRRSLVSAGTFDTIELGARFANEEMMARAFVAAASSSRGYRGPRVKIPVVRSEVQTEEFVAMGRWLGPNARENHRTLSRFGRPGHLVEFDPEHPEVRVLTAAGGICAPQQVNYELPTIGVDRRPVRDQALVRFGADRGGIRNLPIPVLSDVEGAISTWDLETDEDPGEETKACLTITCDNTETEDFVAAIVRCFQTGNFRARYFPEQLRAWMDLANTWQARYAENRLIAAIAASSTNVTSETVLGTTRDLLTGLDRLLAGFASRWRDDTVQMTWLAPFWALRNMATDLARQMPVGTLDETLAVAEGTIEGFFRARPNLSPVWSLDGEAGQVFGTQGDGDILGWPSTIVSYLYPTGSHLFLDGGQQDFGIVRDSVLNATNDFQMFAETMEGHHFHGQESFRWTADVCPDGSASALVDINPCATGS